MYVIVLVLGVTIFLSSPDTDSITALLLSNLIFCVGFFGVFNFIGHSSKKVNKLIGWTSNEFQKELGFVSLGIGICGVLCYWFRDGFWIATAIPFSVFMIGTGILHIKVIMKNGNFNQRNTWIIKPDFVILWQ